MITQCQNCKKLLNIPDAYERKIIKCPSCKRPFQAIPEIEKPLKQTELPATLTPQSNATQFPLPSESVKLETPLSEPSIPQDIRPREPGIIYATLGFIFGLVYSIVNISSLLDGFEINLRLCVLFVLSGAFIWFCFYTVGFIINQLERIAFYAEKNLKIYSNRNR